MKKIGKLASSVFILWLLIGGLVVQAKNDFKIEVNLDPREVAVGEHFLYILSITSTGDFEAAPPNWVAVSGLNLVDQRSSTGFTSRLTQGPSGMEFIKSKSLNIMYELVASKKGKIFIPPLKIKVNGSLESTDGLTVSIGEPSPQLGKKGKGKGRGRSQLPGLPNLPGFPNFPDDPDDADQLLDQFLRRQLPQAQENDQPNIPPPAVKTLPRNADEAFFVTLELDKKEVYAGEQVFASWYIYTRGDIVSLDRDKFPDLRGFWKEEVEAIPNLVFQQEVVNGIPFRKALLAAHALFPIKEGTPVIDEYKVKATVVLPATGGFGFGRPYTYTKSSDRVKLTVKPLPVDGRPKDFSGAIGVYKVEAKVAAPPTPEGYPMGNPFLLHIRFEGDGNAKFIELPPIDWPATVEVFETKSDSKFFKSGKSYKEFQVSLIPKQEGDLELPSFSFSYFDPAVAQFKSLKTEPIKIKITHGTLDPKLLASSRMKGNTTALVGKPVLPELPILIPALEGEPFLFMRSVWFWIVLGLSSLVGIVIQWLKSFDLLTRGQGQRAEVQMRLKKIRAANQQEKVRLVGVESVNLIYFVLGIISEAGGATQEFAVVLDHMPPSVRRELGADLAKAMDLFQTFAFAPENYWTEFKDLKARIVAIDKLEKTLVRAMDLIEMDS